MLAVIKIKQNGKKEPSLLQCLDVIGIFGRNLHSFDLSTLVESTIETEMQRVEGGEIGE